tara:strand:- start:884 stop:1279 length:396 start_codon:yes stop_codon:yes gene_type:complete
MSKNYQYKTKVYYEDTDAGGIVYYANYLKFIERARTEMIYNEFGLTHKQLKENYDIVFIVRACNSKYLKPALFEDELIIFTKVLNKSTVRINLLQEVKRKNELLVVSEVELVTVDKKGKIKKLPKNLLNKL